MKKSIFILICITIINLFLEKYTYGNTITLQDTATLSVEKSEGVPGNVSDSCNISLDNSMGVAGVQFILVFDTTLLTLDTVSATTRSSNMTLGFNKLSGAVKVIMFNLSGDSISPGTGPIVNVSFNINDTAVVGDSTLLQLQDYVLSDPNANYITCVAINNWFHFKKVGIEERTKTPERFFLSVSGLSSQTKLKIEYGIPKKTEINLHLYDVTGRLLKVLYSGVIEKGHYEITVKQKDLKSGTYFIRLTSTEFTTTKKFIILE